MDYERANMDWILAQYKQFILEADRGVFTTKTRNRLAGKLGLSGRDRTINDFWYDVRTSVKTALKDLEMFIMVADKEQINQVINTATLEPLVNAMINFPNVGMVDPDPVLAEIARLFIYTGFEYLRRAKPVNSSISSERIIDEALDLSRLLTLQFYPENLRRAR